MSPPRSLLPLAAGSSTLLVVAALAFAACNDPLTPESEAATLASRPALQVLVPTPGSSVGLGSGLLGSRVHLQTHPQREVKIVTAKVTVPANGGFVNWHTHPMPGVLVVVTGGGTLTLTSEDCSANAYPTGTSFQPPHGIHLAQNLTPNPIELIATFIIQADKNGVFQPPTTPASPQVQAALDAKCGI